MLAACPQDVCWRLVSLSCNANRRLRQLFAVRSRDPNTEGRCVYVLCVLCLLYVCVCMCVCFAWDVTFVLDNPWR